VPALHSTQVEFCAARAKPGGHDNAKAFPLNNSNSANDNNGSTLIFSLSFPSFLSLFLSFFFYWALPSTEKSQTERKGKKTRRKTIE
jgi:hypothetical protein